VSAIYQKSTGWVEGDEMKFWEHICNGFFFGVTAIIVGFLLTVFVMSIFVLPLYMILTTGNSLYLFGYTPLSLFILYHIGKSL
jgi:hypothetical protein